MSEGKRPGGLTALAVINFVFGGFSCIGVLGMAAMFAVIGTVAENSDSSNQAQRDMAAAWEQTGKGVFYAMVAAMALSAFLLISSGVGYLKQSKFWGRTMGNVYAILSIAVSLASALLVAEEANGGFNLMTILGLVYPVLTLVLLNTTFKEDFVR